MPALRIRLTTLLLLALATPLLAQEPPQPPDAGAEGEPPAATQPQEAPVPDAAFEQYVKYQALTEAFAQMNAAGLADAGLQLAEGERILFRKHKAASARPGAPRGNPSGR